MKRFCVIRPFSATAFGLLLLGLSACVSAEPEWYEERCLRYGLQPGTPEFNACTQRDREWIEQENQRARQPGGRA